MPAIPPSADTHQPLESLLAGAVRELAEENAVGPALRVLSVGLLHRIEHYMETRWGGLEDWEATAAEALARVLIKLDNYDPAKGSLIGWAIGIAHYTARSAYRRQTAHEDKPATKYETSHRERYHIASPLSEVQHDALCEAILSLPEADHHLLYLHMIEGLSLADAAKELKITPALARKKKERILKALEKTRLSACESESN